MSVAEQLMGIEAVAMYVPGLVQKLALQEAEIAQLSAQVAQLEAWRDAVPIQAIRDVNGSHVPIDDVIAGVDTVDAWLASLARPEVQP